MIEELAGRWEGDGTTHEEAPFKGTLDSSMAAASAGLPRVVGGLARPSSA